MKRRPGVWFAWFCILSIGAPPPVAAWPGTLVITVTDEKTGAEIPFRMHLKNQALRPVKVPKLPSWGDHFSAPGKVELSLPNGNFAFEMECGPEYLFRSGHFPITDNAQDQKTVTMRRFVNLPEQGWYPGDLYAQRPLKDLELVMAAEQLHVLPNMMWNNKKTEEIPPAKRPKPEEDVPFRRLTTAFDGRIYDLSAGRDERPDNELAYFHLKQPLPVVGAKPFWPPSVELLRSARTQEWSWADATKPSWWDLPLWVALDRVNSVEIAHRDFLRDGNPAKTPVQTGRPRSLSQYPGPRGEGTYAQEIYYHLLNCGLRIPPSAGSGSGVVNNPVGYNRVYVKVDGEFTYEKWWAGLRAGRCFVTNGPLIVVTCEDQYPGYVFSGAEGTTFEPQLEVTLHTREKIDYLEIIQDGELRHALRLDDYVKANGVLPKIAFKESGWFLLRAVCENQKTYRFASSAPFYVDMGGKSRIRKRSVQFFLDWLTEREAQLQKIPDPTQKAAWAELCKSARTFWEERLAKAGAD